MTLKLYLYFNVPLRRIRIFNQTSLTYSLRLKMKFPFLIVKHGNLNMARFVYILHTKSKLIRIIVPRASSKSLMN